MANYYNTVGYEIAQNALRGQGIDPSGLDEAGLISGLQQIFPNEQFKISGYVAPNSAAIAQATAYMSPEQKAAIATEQAQNIQNQTNNTLSRANTAGALPAAQTAAQNQVVSALPAPVTTAQNTTPDTSSNLTSAVDYSPIGSESFTGVPPAANNQAVENPSPGYNPLAGALVDQLGGPNPASSSVAQGLLNQGVSDINDIGVRTVNETRFYPAISDVSAERSEEVPVTQFYNKKTNQIIDPNRVGIIQNGTYGVEGGDVFYNLTTDANGNPTFQEQFSERSRGFMATPIGQLINFGAKFTPAAPISYAYDAYKAADRGDPLGFALAVTGGASSLAGSPLAPDLVGSDWATAGAGTNLARTPLDLIGGQIASGVAAVRPALQIGQAIKNEDWSGLATLGANAVGAGSTPIGNTGFTLGDAGRFASIGVNLANNDFGRALVTLAPYLNSSETELAGRALNLKTAIENYERTGQIGNLVEATTDFGRTASRVTGATQSPAPIVDGTTTGGTSNLTLTDDDGATEILAASQGVGQRLGSGTQTAAVDTGTITDVGGGVSVTPKLTEEQKEQIRTNGVYEDENGDLRRPDGSIYLSFSGGGGEGAGSGTGDGLETEGQGTEVDDDPKLRQLIAVAGVNAAGTALANTGSPAAKLSSLLGSTHGAIKGPEDFPPGFFVGTVFDTPEQQNEFLIYFENAKVPEDQKQKIQDQLKDIRNAKVVEQQPVNSATNPAVSSDAANAATSSGGVAASSSSASGAASSGAASSETASSGTPSSSTAAGGQTDSQAAAASSSGVASPDQKVESDAGEYIKGGDSPADAWSKALAKNGLKEGDLPRPNWALPGGGISSISPAGPTTLGGAGGKTGDVSTVTGGAGNDTADPFANYVRPSAPDTSGGGRLPAGWTTPTAEAAPNLGGPPAGASVLKNTGPGGPLEDYNQQGGGAGESVVLRNMGPGGPLEDYNQQGGGLGESVVPGAGMGDTTGTRNLGPGGPLEDYNQQGGAPVETIVTPATETKTEPAATTKTTTSPPAGTTTTRTSTPVSATSPVETTSTEVKPETIPTFKVGDLGKYLSPLAAYQAMVQQVYNTAMDEKARQEKPKETKLEDDTSFWGYGQEKPIESIFDTVGSLFEKPEIKAATGGSIAALMAAGGAQRTGIGSTSLVPHSGKMRVDFRRGDAVTGPGDGQSDDIPAMLADGEFVFPADVVSALGNGSTKAGSDKLYEMMHSIRARARKAHPKSLPPPAKSPLEYLRGKK